MPNIERLTAMVEKEMEQVEDLLSSAVASEVAEQAQKALQEHTNRRIWLAVSLVPILIVIVLLMLYIRTLPQPGK